MNITEKTQTAGATVPLGHTENVDQRIVVRTRKSEASNLAAL
ncbi:hypothetical protein [Pseudomonas sp. NPDC090201]